MKMLKEYDKEKELLQIENQYKMEYLRYIRETERLKHEWEKERMRIKSAEIRKATQLKNRQRR